MEEFAPTAGAGENDRETDSARTDGPARFVERHSAMQSGEIRAEARLTRNRRIGMARVAHPGIAFGDPPADTYLLTAPLHGRPYVEVEFAGFALRQRTYPGDFVVQHLANGASGFADGRVTVQMTAIDGAWMRALIGEALDGRAPDWEAAATTTFRNEFLSGLVDRMWRRLGADGASGQAWLDDASTLAVRTIAEQVGAGRRIAVDYRPLSPAQRRRVEDFIDAHLGEPIGVAEMAAAAGLSPWHFARRFRAGAGVAPHGYLVRRRMDRARELIADGELPLAAIALASGFSSQAHMTTAFRRHLGRTPGWFVRQG